ncbi:MAG: lipoate--protein ligase [Dysgonamonadaceae bacterium]|jgi:lipoate-protein ligase A|nr:lipoate--protein ligase [Dysgonamonadaceae bacterium]
MPMIYIVSQSTKPQYNIAMEEYCFKKLLKHNKVFMLWINEPSIIVGRHQNTIEEVNSQYVSENAIHVVRRISGGGAVYHDLNNLNYTIISNEEKGSEFDFKTFSEPVIETLKELGVEARFTGRNDLVIGEKKICGNAQAHIKGRVMHHGCILFDTDLSVLSKALEIPKNFIESKSVKSVRSEVTNILPYLPEKIGVKEFSAAILRHVKRKFPEMTEYVFGEAELTEIEKNSHEKFSSWEWNYGRSPQFNITRKTRFNAGKVQVLASVKNSVVEDIKFYGTFFGNNSDLSVVENALKGVKYTAGDVGNALSRIPVSEFFAGFTLDELVEAIID